MMPKADMIWQPLGAPELVQPQLRDLLEKKLGISEGGTTTSARIDEQWASYLTALEDMGVPGASSLLHAVKHYGTVEISMRPRL
jgi:hypothetical protein